MDDRALVDGHKDPVAAYDPSCHPHDTHMNDDAIPPEDMDPTARYATPPVPQNGQAAINISRPPSQLSSQSYPDRITGASAVGASSSDQNNGNSRSHVVIKVGMVGDAQIGKTSLMVKYVEGSWDEDYIQTLGVNFMEKTISIRNTEITFSIWDLGGQREFVNMLPLVCNDAVAILFMFDLTRKSTLNSIKEWYRQGRGFNKTAIPILVGTKYDHFVNFPREDQEEISNQVRERTQAYKAGRWGMANTWAPGSTIRTRNARCLDFQQHQPQHQCSKGESLFLTSWGNRWPGIDNMG